jgi:hypothetical protein
MLGAHTSGAHRAPFAPTGASGNLQDDKGTAMLGLVENAIERLEEAVEQETAALQRRASVDLRSFNERKSQGLLELTRAMRHIEGTTPEPALVTRLTSLRAKLDANSAALKLHLDAVREISAVMADAIRDAEHDGTYSRSIRKGPAPT